MIFDLLKQVKAFVFDVDGVLTNGNVLVTEHGDQLRTFSTRDGYAIQLAIKRGYPVAIITGGKSEGVRLRMEGLGVGDVHLGIKNKLSVLNEWLAKQGLEASEVLFMGDDMPDLEVMQHVGVATCPADAIEEIKGIAHYISGVNGGEGAVRDIMEKVMKLQHSWCADVEVKSN